MTSIIVRDIAVCPTLALPDGPHQKTFSYVVAFYVHAIQKLFLQHRYFNDVQKSLEDSLDDLLTTLQRLHGLSVQLDGPLSSTLPQIIVETLESTHTAVADLLSKKKWYHRGSYKTTLPEFSRRLQKLKSNLEGLPFESDASASQVLAPASTPSLSNPALRVSTSAVKTNPPASAAQQNDPPLSTPTSTSALRTNPPASIPTPNNPPLRASTAAINTNPPASIPTPNNPPLSTPSSTSATKTDRPFSTPLPPCAPPGSLALGNQALDRDRQPADTDAEGTSDKISFDPRAVQTFVLDQLVSRAIIPQKYVLCQKDASSKLGEGGFGAVYRGQYQGTNVAVKFMDFSTMDPMKRAVHMELLHNEIGIMCLVQHPYIVKVFGLVMSDRYRPQLVTELMPNGTLFGLIQRAAADPTCVEATLLRDENTRIAKDIAFGMMYLYSQAIQHRDLKSMNVLMDEKMRCRITDFGLSVATSKDVPVFGWSPYWAAPEVFRNEPFTEKCDVYSFGAVLWEVIKWSLPPTGGEPIRAVKATTPIEKTMVCCVNLSPYLRPSFEEIPKLLDGSPAPALTGIPPTVDCASMWDIFVLFARGMKGEALRGDHKFTRPDKLKGMYETLQQYVTYVKDRFWSAEWRSSKHSEWLELVGRLSMHSTWHWTLCVMMVDVHIISSARNPLYLMRTREEFLGKCQAGMSGIPSDDAESAAILSEVKREISRGLVLDGLTPPASDAANELGDMMRHYAQKRTAVGIGREGNAPENERLNFEPSFTHRELVRIIKNVAAARQKIERIGVWSSAVEEECGKIGVVECLGSQDGIRTARVRTYARSSIWPLDALTKGSPIRVGDVVRVFNDPQVRALQDGHGGWRDWMEQYLGAFGRVVEIDADCDVKVLFPDGKMVTWNGMVLTVEDPLRTSQLTDGWPRFRFGAHVQVKDEVFGSNLDWHCIKRGSIGVAKRVLMPEGFIVCDFPEQDDIALNPSELQLDTEADRMRPGEVVKIRPDAKPRYGMGAIKCTDSGQIVHVALDGHVLVSFRYSSPWTGCLNELTLAKRD